MTPEEEFIKDIERFEERRKERADAKRRVAAENVAFKREWPRAKSNAQGTDTAGRNSSN